MDDQRTCAQCGQRYAPDVIFCPKDGAPLAARKTEIAEDPYLGLVVFSQFEIKQLIGIGAMGRVYRAHQSGIERDVAIKILHREFLRNPTVLTRFHREAKVASMLSHPNVVQVLMTGDLPREGPHVGGEACLVMEYLDGISLRSALAAAGGALSMPRALHIVLQVCDAVGEAHTRGVIHRDLKPENVMLVRRGDDRDFVKVLDFGVARLAGMESTVATQAGVIFGTARYISPEGAEGHAVGAPGDVYALATLLYQCLSGETPFDADSPVKILMKHASEAPRDVRSVPRASYVPEPLARVIMANLAKRPEERCRDAREFGRAVVEAAREGGLSPAELIAPSTLLGQQALYLASLERTKSLGLTPELSRQMRGGTALLEPGLSSARDAVHAERGEAARVEPARIEPTVADVPAPALGRASFPSLPGAGPLSERASLLSPVPSSTQVPSRPELTPLPTSKQMPSQPGHTQVPLGFPDDVPSERPEPGGAWRRWGLVAATFVVGALLALLTAQQLGVFDAPEPPMAEYARRAERALIAQAWDSPPGENVKSITDAALRRWPNAPSIMATRQQAARELVALAERRVERDPAEAERWVLLAAELNPAEPGVTPVLEAIAERRRETERARVQAAAEERATESPRAPRRPSTAQQPRPRIEPKSPRPASSGSAPSPAPAKPPEGAAPPPSAAPPSSATPDAPPRPATERGRWL